VALTISPRLEATRADRHLDLAVRDAWARRLREAHTEACDTRIQPAAIANRRQTSGNVRMPALKHIGPRTRHRSDTPSVRTRHT